MVEFVQTSTLLEPRPVEGSKDTTMVVNMGPQHPSTHGVLRLVVEIDGETVLKVVPGHRLPAHRNREDLRSEVLPAGCSADATASTTFAR